MSRQSCGKRSTAFCAMNRWIDGHLHVTKELLPYLEEVRCLANADNPEEYRLLKEAALSDMTISAGIHPWKADAISWAEMEPVLREAPVIGEIGLDNVWCAVDMKVQRAVFCRQLALARQLQKPVVLHTKGMEREILDTIRQYPNRYLVHWYACESWLSEYIGLGCWFTVGPDVMLDRNVEKLARTVPIDKLLIESDGLEGIGWGQGRTLTATDYPTAMEQHLQAVADLRNMGKEVLAAQMERNLDEFLRG